MTEPNRQSEENEERIIEIEIERLRPFKEHPFQVKDDKEMFLLQESIEKYGILNPLIVRPVPDGYYEIISGHRRKHAAEKLGYRKVPVIIRVLSEELVRIRKKSFTEGMATSTEVIDAETMLASVKVARLAAYYEYDVALMNLLSLCGTPEQFANYQPKP